MPPDHRPPVDNAFSGPLIGGAEEATFSGALSFMRRRYTKDVTGADVVVWGVPYDGATSNRPGARFGPQAIRRASAIFDGDPQYPSGRDPFAKLTVVDYGDCFLPRGHQSLIPKAIADQATAILKTGAHLITLGGDHFVTLPLLRAHAAKHGPLALVQFDAHQDTWDDGAGAISHGSFVLEAVREGLIDVSRSIQIGIRTIAPRNCGIRVLDAYEAHGMGLGAIVETIREHVGAGPAYLTFDIDCLDPSCAPGTGTPVAGGLLSIGVLKTLWLLRDINWKGMDIMEVSPPYDHADITAIAAATVVNHYIQGLAMKIKQSS